MPSVATEFACPTCLAAGQTNRINATDGAIICTGNGEHLWRDTEVFMKLRPTRAFTVTPPKSDSQTFRAEIKLSVLPELKKKLEDKFGASLDTMAVGILQTMLEGTTLVVGQTDLLRIGERLGKVPESSGELFGMIFSLGMDRDTAEQNAALQSNKLTAATTGKMPGMVVINLGDQLESAQQQARGRETTVEDFCETALKNGIANNWF